MAQKERLLVFNNHGVLPLADLARTEVARYSGSLYIPNDANCFQDSAGTTAGAKDAVVGYLKDLVGTNHATQATTGYKPILRKGAVNLLKYSEQFDNAAWSKNNASITANAAVAPDGTLTADKLVDSADSTQHYTVQAYNFSTATAYTVSVFAKYESRRYLQIRGDYPSTTYATFDLVNGVVGLKNAAVTSSSIQSVGNGWYRCQMTFTTTGSGAGNVMFNLANADSASAVAYTGDGTSGIYIWGAQLELGSTASTYVATTSAPASNGIGPWHVDFDDTDDRIALASVPLQMTDSGVIMISCRPTAAGTLFSEGNTADADSRISVGINASGYATATWTADDGLTTATITGSTDLRGTDCVIEIAKSGNDKSLWVNGVQIGATNSTVIGTTTLNTAKIGCLASTTDSDFASGFMYGIDSMVGVPTASERAIVRRYLASLGGFNV